MAVQRMDEPFDNSYQLICWCISRDHIYNHSLGHALKALNYMFGLLIFAQYSIHGMKYFRQVDLTTSGLEMQYDFLMIFDFHIHPPAVCSHGCRLLGMNSRDSYPIAKYEVELRNSVVVRQVHSWLFD